MFDHMTIGVADFARSIDFYDRALAPLGIQRLIDLTSEQSDGVRVAAFGDARPRFWLVEENVTSGLLHIAFEAKDHEEVQAFHAEALSAGGADNGAPGLRPHYHPDYFAAFVMDPDGHNIEAVCHLPRP